MYKQSQSRLLTETIQWDLMLSIQKLSSTRLPVLFNNSFSWLRVKGRVRFLMCMMLDTGFLGGDGDRPAAVGSSGSIRGLGWLILRMIFGSGSLKKKIEYTYSMYCKTQNHALLKKCFISNFLYITILLW